MGEGSYMEFTAYRVIGVISPDTGKMVSIDDSDSSRFGGECSFYMASDEWDERYTTTVHMKDVEAAWYMRMVAGDETIVTLTLMGKSAEISSYVVIDSLSAICEAFYKIIPRTIHLKFCPMFYILQYKD